MGDSLRAVGTKPLPVMPPLKSKHVSSYEIFNQLGSGTYGTIFRARDRQTGQIVALKKMTLASGQCGFHLTSLREITVLRATNHKNIVQLKDVCVGDLQDDIYLVLEYCEYDLAALLERGVRFSAGQSKAILLQLIAALKHLHDRHILHRDLKLSNLLFTAKGELKLADFGLARRCGDPPGQVTPAMVTLWYRAPEILLGMAYGPPADMWALGCVMGELWLGRPLLPGRTPEEQLAATARLLGSANARIWPDVAPALPLLERAGATGYSFSALNHSFPSLSACGRDLLARLLTYDPAKRITAAAALAHPWFLEAPAAVPASALPIFSSQTQHAHQTQQQLLAAQAHAQHVLSGVLPLSAATVTAPHAQPAVTAPRSRRAHVEGSAAQPAASKATMAAPNNTSGTAGRYTRTNAHTHTGTHAHRHTRSQAHTLTPPCTQLRGAALAWLPAATPQVTLTLKTLTMWKQRRPTRPSAAEGLVRWVAGREGGVGVTGARAVHTTTSSHGTDRQRHPGLLSEPGARERTYHCI